MIEIFILSLIQGITEFLPISSSSHLILISEFYNFSNGGLSVDVALHIGSFFAVILLSEGKVCSYYDIRGPHLKEERLHMPVGRSLSAPHFTEAPYAGGQQYKIQQDRTWKFKSLSCNTKNEICSKD